MGKSRRVGETECGGALGRAEKLVQLMGGKGGENVTKNGGIGPIRGVWRRV